MVKTRITDTFVRGLGPAPIKKRLEFYDTILPGFCVRVTENGTKSFAVVYRTPSGMKRVTLGAYPRVGVADAREKARDAYKGILNKGDPAAEKREARESPSFGQIADRFVEDYARSSLKRWQTTVGLIERYLKPQWGNHLATDITRGDVKELLRRVEKVAGDNPHRRSPTSGAVQANRVLATARRIYSWAIAEEIIDTTNPCIGVKKRAEQERDRVLSEDEILRVWDAFGHITPTMEGLLKLQLITAQRGGELRSMRWDEIDGEVWTIPAKRSKNGVAHRVPLSSLVLSILERLPKDDEWVFPSPKHRSGHVMSTQKAMRKTRDESGVDFQAHDLRRSAASYMASIGIEPFTIGKLLNHADPRGVTTIYDRYSYDEEKRRALDSWGRRLTEIVSGKNLSAVTNIVELPSTWR